MYQVYLYRQNAIIFNTPLTSIGDPVATFEEAENICMKLNNAMNVTQEGSCVFCEDGSVFAGFDEAICD